MRLLFSSRLALIGLLWLMACGAPSAPNLPPPSSSLTGAALPTALPSVTPAPPTPPAPPQPSSTLAPPTSTPAPPVRTPSPAYDLVLLGATLIDATGGPPLPNSAVAIRDGRIVAIGVADSFDYRGAYQVREFRNATLLPGFINAHAHVEELDDEALRGWTRAGVTTVRDLAASVALTARRDALVASGDLSFPRLIVAGPMVTIPGGHPIPVYGLSDEVLVVRGPADAKLQIGNLIDAGVDQIKIAVSGRRDVRWPEISNDEIAAISETTRARGVQLTAHVDRASALERAVRNGINDAAHSPRDRVPDEVFALMVERRVSMAPTIDVYEALAIQRGNIVEWRRIILPVMYDNLRRFAAAGGILALGDDYGGAPGVEIGMPMAEIAHWLAAGLNPQQIIEAGTRGSAIAIGRLNDLGTVEVGKIADLLVVEGDPLREIEALTRPILVLRSGVIVE